MSKSRHGMRIGLVGHRGYPERYPENSISGMVAAIEAGASGIEFDVQMTADLVPVLLHDAHLERTTDGSGLVMDLTWPELNGLPSGEPKRFGNQFPRDRLPTLRTAVNILAGMPPVRVFVEIKEESLARFGVETVMDRVLPVLAPIGNLCVLISFHEPCLRYARQAGWPNDIGWVFDTWDEEHRATAESLSPAYLFTNWQKIPEDIPELWPGPWRWVLYDITSAEVAMHWAKRGAAYVETWAMGELRQDLAKLTRKNNGQ